MNSPPLPEEHIRLWDGTINPTFKKDKVKVNGNHIDFLTNAQNFKSEGSEFVFTSTGFLASQNGVGMSRVNVMVSGRRPDLHCEDDSLSAFQPQAAVSLALGVAETVSINHDSYSLSPSPTNNDPISLAQDANTGPVHNPPGSPPRTRSQHPANASGPSMGHDCSRPMAEPSSSARLPRNSVQSNQKSSTTSS